MRKGVNSSLQAPPLIWIGALVGTAGLTLAIVNTADRNAGYTFSYGPSQRYDNGPKRSPLGGWMLFGLGAASSIIGVVNVTQATNHFGPAIRQYNEKLGLQGTTLPPQPRPAWSMSVEPIGLGAAVTVRF